MSSKHPEYRVVIAQGPEVAVGSDWGAASFLLPHPKTGRSASFIVSGGCLQEVNWFKPRFGSWFAGDIVLEDGGMYLCTPVDPLFIVLPLLEATGAQAGMFCELEVLMEAAPKAVTQHVLPLLGAGQLACLCDAKEADGEAHYRLSQPKVLAWLGCKVQQTLAGLRAAGTSYDSMDQASLEAYAVGLLGEYLPDAWLKRLLDAFNISACGEENVHTQPCVPDARIAGPPEKRQKLDPKEFARKRAALKKAEEKAAKEAKQAEGMQKMTSFFAKPKLRSATAAEAKA